MCYSVETVNDSSDIDRGYQDEPFGNPQGILAKGLLDPRNTESVYKTLLYDLDNQFHDDYQLPDTIENFAGRDLQQKPQKRIILKKNSFNHVGNEVEETPRSIPDSTSFNAVRSYGIVFSRLSLRPIIRIEVKAEDPYDQEELLFATTIPLRPNLDIINAIFSAALQQYLKFPSQSNPYNVVLDYDVNRNCDIIISALDIPNIGTHTWKVKIKRRRGKVTIAVSLLVIYDGVSTFCKCLVVYI
ncbi:unnamed protein product [Mytilus coruscus]|uniref:Uncharacterized protein n=1 Tax=Mytilus coruscus TaxID=42192 RepID=A0A6J8DRI6_MYTCO|nr:unnamed protein product [Mytilus coruscus]